MIEKVGVVGAGTMGSGIAEVALRAGLDTVVVELDAAAAEAARERIERSLARAVERGRLTAGQRDTALARMTMATTLDALADRDLVVEAVLEDEAMKLDVFSALDRLTGDSCILASNTSSIPIVRLGASTNRPDRVLGLHFFNPAQVQPLVELVPSLATSDATLEAVETFARGQLDKHPIRARDRAGFVVNRLLVPYLLAAIRLYDEGLGTREDIDEGMKLGCAHPMGPLELADLIGLDVVAAVGEVLYEEFRDPAYAPPALLRRMVTAGTLGRKTGTGFYDYR